MTQEEAGQLKGAMRQEIEALKGVGYDSDAAFVERALARIEMLERENQRLKQSAWDVAEARMMVHRLICALDKDEWEEGETSGEARDVAWDMRASWGMCPSQTSRPEAVVANYVAQRAARGEDSKAVTDGR